MSATSWSEYYGEYSYYGTMARRAPRSRSRRPRTLIDGLPTNGDVIVAYIPDSSGRGVEDYDYGPTPAAETIVPGDWVFSGGVEKDTAVGQRAAPGHGLPGRARSACRGYVRRASRRRTGRHLLPGGRQAGADRADRHRDRPAAQDGHGDVRRRAAGLHAQRPDHGRGRRAVRRIRCRAPTRSPSRSAPGRGWRCAQRGGRLLLTARVAPATPTGSVVVPAPGPRPLGHRRSARSSRTDGVADVIDARGATKVRARFAGGSMPTPRAPGRRRPSS